MAVSQKKKKKKRTETQYINKLSQYMHLSNSGFSVSLDVSDVDTTKYPHAKIQMRTGAFGVLNSNIELVAASHANNFVTPEQLMKLSYFFAQAAKIVHEAEVIRAHSSAERRLKDRLNDKEIERFASFPYSLISKIGAVNSDDKEKAMNGVRNRFTRLANKDIVDVKDKLKVGIVFDKFVEHIKDFIQPILDQEKEEKLARQESHGGKSASLADMVFPDESIFVEPLEYTPEEQKMIEEIYSSFATPNNEED